MPIGTLKFKLPEEREDFELAQKCHSLDMTITELDNYLRSKIKYGNLAEEQYRIYQEIRDKLSELQSYD